MDTENWTGVENYALLKKVRKLFNAQQAIFLEDDKPVAYWSSNKKQRQESAKDSE